MAKETLLSIVQEILSDMNSDQVNSISDTEEAMQVAQIIKRVFYNMAMERDFPHQKKLVSLTPSTDPNRPTHMRIEDNIIDIEWVKYDCRRDVNDPIKYKTISYVQPEVFLARVMARDASAENRRMVIDYNGTPLIIFDNAEPTFYTSFDDKHLVFDSFDTFVDSTLQSSKTQVFAEVEPTFVLKDDAVPELPSKLFVQLVNEAKSTCFLTLKEVFHEPSARAAAKSRAWMSRNKRRISGGIRYPDYGRKK